MHKLLLILTMLLWGPVVALSQGLDSTLEKIQRKSLQYVDQVDQKITLYTNRITDKTEKTLTKLSRWENKIKSLLEKTSPETATRLFGNNQLTFTSLLEQVKKGEDLALQYKAPYDKYRDDLHVELKYLATQKKLLDSGLIKQAKAAGGKIQELAEEEGKSEAIQQFIKMRKKQLIDQSFAYLGNSKYLSKINKESYYYVETLRNYKEIFNDSRKAEQTVKTVLNKIPAFRQFVQKNSMLAALFGSPGDDMLAANTGSLAGLQARANVQNIIQGQLGAAGPNGLQALNQNIQSAQSELSRLKDQLINAGRSSSSQGELPDFKPNMQKTKTLRQRIEFGFNVQFAKANNLLPTTSDIALSMGYKLNDKSLLGIGASYKLGLGSIQHIQLSHEGMGLRSFLDWKLKKQLYITGGYELNHYTQFDNFASLKNFQAWQSAALIGLTRKLNIKTKFFKASNVQLLFDFLSQQHVPATQPVLFRVDYKF